ncbi:MAG TPA: methylmalonyl-CoA mutase family protein, partial [Jatrophihabitans sp.]|nr:methylmalonyl-CoA mutase family protein [Jatrophihabitans sp.]
PPFVRAATPDAATASGWDVRVRHGDGVPDPVAVNRAVLADLENGATSVWLTLGGPSLAVGDLDRALDGVYLELAPVVLDAGADAVAAADALLALAGRRHVAPGGLRGSFGADPVGTRVRTGTAPGDELFPELVERCRQAPALRVATADATVWHEAGASDAQELGLGTAVGVAYLRALTGAGLGIDEALAALDFRWAVGVEQFPSIAKLRAARRIWDRVADVCGAADGRRGQDQHAVTSTAMLTERDPWVNLLRATIGCFAAAVGGAGAITVTPFDAALGVSDDFARRIARNTQSILHDESSLARVIDAAGGSWFVESLTDELAAAGWEVFTGIERAGGIAAALDAGTVDGLLRPVRERRAADIAHRRRPITGVSEYAFVDEPPVQRPPRPAPPAGLLPQERYAAPYEQLRGAADAAPERPTVFLAGLGSLAASNVRSSFASTLFHAGGLACVTAAGDRETLVTSFRASGATVACLCGTDKAYAADGAELARALRDAGATQLWLAGRAEVDGVDGRLYAGCDALAVLRAVHDHLGVAR